MFTQKAKSYIKKFTVMLMLLSFTNTSAFAVSEGLNNYLEGSVNETSIRTLNNYEQPSLAPVKLNQTVKITDATSKVNLSLRDSDVKQVLRMFAQKADLNVIFHSSVNGKITLDLVDVTLNEAFLLVLRSAELNYILEGKNLVVASANQSKNLSFNKQNLTIIPVKYENARNIANFLNNNIFGAKITGLSNDKIVSANPSTNEILIFGSENDIDVAKKIIEKLDQKPMINSFKVNHTTPKEMAKLLCNTFVETGKDVSTEDEEEEDEEEQEDEEDEIKSVKLGSGIVACRATLAAMQSDSESNGDGSGSVSVSSEESSVAGVMNTFNSAPMSIVYFPELGKINVNGGSYEQVQVIKEFIEMNDKKQPMAYVEVSVIELNESGSKEFSNEWTMWTPFISLGFNTSSGLTTNQYNPIFFAGDGYSVVDSEDPSSVKYSVSKYQGSETIVYKLKYLVTNGKGRVLTNPKLMVTNGQKSVIDMTSDYVKTVKSELITTIDNAGYSRTYEVGDDEGLKIEMIPFISPDGYVSLSIKPEFATIKEKIYAPGQSGVDELQATLLQRRDLTLKNIRVKDGETLVLAGLIKENETQQVTKIPVLGDLPIIGVFFRSSSNQKSKEELVIMITPHIVYSQDDINNIKTVDL